MMKKKTKMRRKPQKTKEIPKRQAKTSMKMMK
jgi:hypothetical protein